MGTRKIVNCLTVELQAVDAQINTLQAKRVGLQQLLASAARVARGALVVQSSGPHLIYSNK
jgi:hypothetical protein